MIEDNEVEILFSFILKYFENKSCQYILRQNRNHFTIITSDVDTAIDCAMEYHDINPGFLRYSVVWPKDSLEEDKSFKSTIIFDTR